MKRTKENPERESRITDSIVVDAYDEYERHSGWYCCLADKVEFPVRAKCVEVTKGSPLKLNEEVSITGIVEEREPVPFWAIVAWRQAEISVPLATLEIIEKSKDPDDVVADWRYWVSMGYSF